MVLVPPDTPVTTPVVFTVAVLLAVLHTPPVARLESVRVAPWQTVDAPDMLPAVRKAPIEMVFVVDAVPHTLVTV